MEWDRSPYEPDEDEREKPWKEFEKDQVPPDWEPSPETIRSIYQVDEPEAVTPEHQETHKRPENLPEKEPGSPFRPSWDASPDEKGSEKKDASELRVDEGTTDEVPSDWRPSPETIETLYGEEGAEQKAAKNDTKQVEPGGTIESKGEKDLVEPTVQIMKEKRAENEGLLVHGDAAEMDKLASSFEKLESTECGRSVTKAIREHGVTARFGETDSDAIAQFDPKTDVITICEELKNASPEVLAAHLAHEGTHVQWNERDSIDQEYYAFKAEADVWDSLKGSRADKQCDWVSAMVGRGEAEAKMEIRQMYPDLPEHWPPS